MASVCGARAKRQILSVRRSAPDWRTEEDALLGTGSDQEIAAKLNRTFKAVLLIDLGEGKPFAQRFLASYRNSGLAVPPTVVQELVFIATTGHPAQAFALEALTNMRRWNITPFDLIAVGHGITEVNARKLMESGLLTEGEFNDGLIVIETALAGIPTLITSDKHLLLINPPQLAQKLNEFHLAPVSIYHPRDFVR